MYTINEHNILIFLVQVFLLLACARLLGELFRAWKQPAITAEILAGVLLGPTIFGRFFPGLHAKIFTADLTQLAMLETVAWLGLLFFLLEAGLNMDFSSAWRHRGKALVIAFTGILVPMALGFACCYFLPDRFLVHPGQRVAFSLFMATIMTISAMPITIRTLNDLNVAKTDLGFLIMSALSVNEIIGWMLFTLVFGFLVQAHIAISHTLVVFFMAIAFTVFCLTAGRRFADFVITKIHDLHLSEPASSLTFLCLMGLLCGAVFQRIGIHALLGFFIAGIVAGEAKALPERTRQVISQMVYAIFVPLFFTMIGLGTDFFKHFDWFLVLFVSAIGIFGKFAGAWLGVTLTRLPRVNRLAVAIAHTPGGSMEIVIGALALKYNLISPPMFVAIVLGGIISAVILGPWLKVGMCRRKAISILEFFSRREIVAQAKSQDRDELIRELCAVAHEQGNMPPADLLSLAVIKRENLMGTAIEERIALPHARIPWLIRPKIVFARSEPGIEWNSPDGKLAHFVFLILTPLEDDDIQVQILRILVKTICDKKLQEALIEASSAEHIWQLFEKAFTVQQVVRSRKGKKRLARAA